jgi:hypothetical protein
MSNSPEDSPNVMLRNDSVKSQPGKDSSQKVRLSMSNRSMSAPVEHRPTSTGSSGPPSGIKSKRK